MKIKYLGAASALALTMGTATSAMADCGEVSITEMDWASACGCDLDRELPDDPRLRLCNVTVVPTTTVPAITSVAETGEPDIITELWTSYTEVYEELRAAGQTWSRCPRCCRTAASRHGGSPITWPQHIPELTTLEGIKANPELVGGRFHDCPDRLGL